MISWIVGLICLPLLLWLPGAVLLRALFGPTGPARTDGAGWAFLAIAGSVLWTGWLGFTLAEIGWFSLGLLVAGTLLACLAVVAVAAGERRAVGPTLRRWLGELGARTMLHARRWLPGRHPPPGVGRPHVETIVLVVLLLIGGGLFARPAEMIRGALNSGTYVNAGIALARSGSIVLHDQLMRELRDDDPVTFAPDPEARQFLQPLNLERYSLNRLRMPGFYMLEKKSGMVLPQFYSLYPVWLAIGYALFGLGGALMFTPLLALLACLAVYFFTRRLFSTRVALVALAFLIVCPLQIWFARYPVSEIPTELLAFLFFYAFLRFTSTVGRLGALEAAAAHEDQPAGDADAEAALSGLTARYFGVLAGVALGELALTRVDFIFYLLPLPIFLLWWRLGRTWRREHTWFAVTAGLLLLQWLVYFIFFAFAYTMDEFHNVILDQRRAWPRLLPLLYVGLIVLVLLDRLQPRWRPLVGAAGAAIARRRRWLLGGLVVVVGAYIGYLYVWQPNLLWGPDARAALAQGHIPFAWQSYIGAPLPTVAMTGKSVQTGLTTTNSFILVRLGWYLSPLGILLGAAGLLRALWKRLTAGSAYFFAMLLMLGGLFSAETFTNPVYPYSLRHFLPVVIPGLLILAAYVLGWAAEKWRPRRLIRPVAWAVAGALVLFFLATGWVIISHTEEDGALAEIQALAARFPDPAHTVLLFSNERDEPYIVATPLQYIFGFNCFSVQLPYGSLDEAAIQGAVQRWQQQGYQVYAILGANGGKLHLPDLALEPYTAGGPPEWTYSVTELEQLYTQKPKNIAPASLAWGLYRFVPRAQATLPPLPFQVDIGGADFRYLAAGFAPQEKTHPSDSDAWRWTGGNAYLRLPVGTGVSQTLTLTLRLSAGPAQRAVPLPDKPSAAQQAAAVRAPDGSLVLPAPATVTVAAGPLTLGKVTLPLPPAGGDPIFEDATFTVPADAPRDPADPAYLLIHLSSSTWSPADVGVSADARALGAIVDTVRLAPGPTAQGRGGGAAGGR